MLATITRGAAQIGSEAPARLARLQRDIELVNLDQLIIAYAEALDAGHKEDWWQRFFERNVFVLQLLFGGPTVFVDAQVPIGEGANSANRSRQEPSGVRGVERADSDGGNGGGPPRPGDLR